MAKLSIEMAAQVRARHAPAGTNCHQVPCSRAELFCAQYKIVPQLTVVRSPSPRNCSAASEPMPYPMAPNRTLAISEDRLGRTSATMIRSGRSPMTVAAAM